jgi:hypothetical protein
MPHRSHLNRLVDLVTGKTLGEIKAELPRRIPGAKVRYDANDNPHGFFCVTYDMLNTDWNTLGSKACRGTIFRVAHDAGAGAGAGADADAARCTGEVVCLPYYKFFNAGEGHADTTVFVSSGSCDGGGGGGGDDGDNDNAVAATDKGQAANGAWGEGRLVAEEKLDGSLVKVFWYANGWKIASNGTANAYNCPVRDIDGRFASLGAVAEHALDTTLPAWRTVLDGSKTYLMEVLSPYNRVVVAVDAPEIYHLGTRCRKTHVEETDHCVGLPRPKVYPLGDVAAARVAASALEGQEGFVLKSIHPVDGCVRRVKIKSPWYLTMHGVGTKTFTDDELVRCILDGLVDDVLGAQPHLAARVALLRRRIAATVERAESVARALGVSPAKEAVAGIDTAATATDAIMLDPKARGRFMRTLKDSAADGPLKGEPAWMLKFIIGLVSKGTDARAFIRAAKKPTAVILPLPSQ